MEAREHAKLCPCCHCRAGRGIADCLQFDEPADAGSREQQHAIRAFRFQREFHAAIVRRDAWDSGRRRHRADVSR